MVAAFRDALENDEPWTDADEAAVAEAGADLAAGRAVSHEEISTSWPDLQSALGVFGGLYEAGHLESRASLEAATTQAIPRRRSVVGPDIARHRGDRPHPWPDDDFEALLGLRPTPKRSLSRRVECPVTKKLGRGGANEGLQIWIRFLDFCDELGSAIRRG